MFELRDHKLQGEGAPVQYEHGALLEDLGVEDRLKSLLSLTFSKDIALNQELLEVFPGVEFEFDLHVVVLVNPDNRGNHGEVVLLTDPGLDFVEGRDVLQEQLGEFHVHVFYKSLLCYDSYYHLSNSNMIKLFGLINLLTTDSMVL